jgi:hypothetical protein
VPLLAHNDLDNDLGNYLFPLVPKLTAATGEEAGTVLRSDAVRRYAERAGIDRVGFDGVEVVPIAHDLWRFYRPGAR